MLSKDEPQIWFLALKELIVKRETQSFKGFTVSRVKQMH